MASKNVRFKGNAVGNAQNLVIRNILSNLGYESFSKQDWEETMKHFGNKCVYCGSDENIECDHAIPINREKLGEHRLGNLVPACSRCNSKKGSQDYIEFCDNNENIITQINEYMESRNYIPLSVDESKCVNIQIVLQKAHEEIRIAAERYIEMINDLFFDDVFDDERSSIEDLENSEHEIINIRKKSGSPEKQFILKGAVCKKDEFETFLKSNPCDVKVTLYYRDSQEENKVWNAGNFSINSSLSRNLGSGYLRDWKGKGIIGIKLEV